MNISKNELYNADQKNKYISYCILTANTDKEDSYRTGLVNFFKRLGAFEKKYESDFANLSFDVMKELISEFAKGNIGYQRNILSHLTQYVTWSRENFCSNLTVNPLQGVKIEDLNSHTSYTDTMVSSLDELTLCLNKKFAPLEDNTIDNQFRAACMLLFEGLKVDEIIYLKENQIDNNSKTVLLDNRDIILSDETFKVVNFVLQQPIIRSAIKEGSVKEFQITKVGYFLENSRPVAEKKEDKYREVYSNCFKVGLSKKLSELSKVTKKLNSKKIYLSGIFSRMYKQECNGEEISFEEYFEAKKNNAKTFLQSESVKRDIYEEYKIWKKSFFE